MPKYKFQKNINQKKLPFLYLFLKWLILILIMFVLLSLLIKPFRKNWSNDYTKRGNIYLEQKKYLTAELQYKKALILNGKNEEARTMFEFSTSAEKDVLELEDFYKNRNLSVELELFEKAKAIPGSESEAVKIARELIDKEQYQLAIIPAKTATLMDKTYAEAWIYLGIANFRTAGYSEIRSENRENYLKEAKEAFLKAKELEPDNETANQYLENLK